MNELDRILLTLGIGKFDKAQLRQQITVTYRTTNYLCFYHKDALHATTATCIKPRLEISVHTKYTCS